jgi:hypothetical protein
MVVKIKDGTILTDIRNNSGVLFGKKAEFRAGEVRGGLRRQSPSCHKTGIAASTSVF